MRRYDEPVQVRRGRVAGPGRDADPVEGPEQFVWKDRRWSVRAVLAHWVETGPWWQSSDAQAVLGADPPDDPSDDPFERQPDGRPLARPLARADLTAEREVWRVEACRGSTSARRRADEGDRVSGVFDLVVDWIDGEWRLVRCLD